MPVQEINSIAHKVVIQDGVNHEKTIRLAEKEILNRDFILRWKVSRDTMQFASLAHRADQDSGYFALIIDPPERPAPQEIVPREITFIMDNSGSMQGLPIQTSQDLVSRTL